MNVRLSSWFVFVSRGIFALFGFCQLRHPFQIRCSVLIDSIAKEIIISSLYRCCPGVMTCFFVSYDHRAYAAETLPF